MHEIPFSSSGGSGLATRMPNLHNPKEVCPWNEDHSVARSVHQVSFVIRPDFCWP